MSTPAPPDLPTSDLEAMLAEARRLVDQLFEEQRTDPSRGRIEVAGERYVLVRGASLSIEFFDLVRGLLGPERTAEADAFSRNFLYDLGHALGRSDARRIHSLVGLSDPLGRIAAGPAHFARAGWATVRMLRGTESRLGPGFTLVYAHPESFEAEAWLGAGRASAFPVCIMNAGYSSGWVSESIETEHVATEVTCRARGDAECTFVMASPDRVDAAARQHLGQAAPTVGPLPEVQDFFARKRMEEELRQAKDELELRVAERTAELERTVQRLQAEQEARALAEQRLAQAMGLDAVGRLAGGIAHDFGNITAIILNCAELLEEETGEHEQLRMILAAAERAAALTDQLRRVSRGQQPLPRLVDVDEVLAELVRLADRGLGQGARVRLQPSGAAATAWIDPSQLEQVVLNLVVNARQAMADGSTVRVRCRLVEREDTPRAVQGLQTEADTWVRIDVADTGHGIPAELQERIFRADFTTKGPGLGTGLGLATVASIVERAGGTITVLSAVGRGSTFTVWLPHRTEEPEEDTGDPLSWV